MAATTTATMEEMEAMEADPIPSPSTSTSSPTKKHHLPPTPPSSPPISKYTRLPNSPKRSPSSKNHQTRQQNQNQNLFTCTLPPLCSPPRNTPSIFSTEGALQSHYETHHSNVCSETGCGKIFPSDWFLQLHQTENHDPLVKVRQERGEKIFHCLDPLCPRKFTTPKSRRRHLLQPPHSYPKEFFFSVVNRGMKDVWMKYGLGEGLMRRRWKSREEEGEGKMIIDEKMEKEKVDGDGDSASASAAPHHEIAITANQQENVADSIKGKKTKPSKDDTAIPKKFRGRNTMATAGNRKSVPIRVERESYYGGKMREMRNGKVDGKGDGDRHGDEKKMDEKVAGDDGLVPDKSDKMRIRRLDEGNGMESSEDDDEEGSDLDNDSDLDGDPPGVDGGVEGGLDKEDEHEKQKSLGLHPFTISSTFGDSGDFYTNNNNPSSSSPTSTATQPKTTTTKTSPTTTTKPSTTTTSQDLDTLTTTMEKLSMIPPQIRFGKRGGRRTFPQGSGARAVRSHKLDGGGGGMREAEMKDVVS